MDEVSKIVAELGRVLPPKGLIMVVGGPDTGKSTMAAALASWYFARGLVVSVVDGDIGQSDVGPPGFVSYGLLREEVSLLAHVPRAGSYLVGATSPYGRLLATVAGVSTCACWAQRDGAEVIIVDTCGLVGGSAGVRLKCAKAAALCPDLVLVLSAGWSLVSVKLRELGYRVEVISPLAGARMRTAEERRQNRSVRWSRYLKEASVTWVERASYRIVPWWADSARPNSGHLPRGTVVAFPDQRKPGLQVPAVWLGEDQGVGRVIAPHPVVGSTGVLWTTSYVLLLSEDGCVLRA
ncbi:MAG: Clp1/GlmU family protein [Bacillota bacterium]